MKTMLLGLGVLLFACTGTLRAEQPSIPPDHPANCAQIKANILANLHSANDEVRASTIQLIIDLNEEFPQLSCRYAVIPLLERLRTDQRCEIRMLAALALYKLDSDLGRFAVSRRVFYDPSERVARLCDRLVRNWDVRESGPVAPQPAPLAADGVE
jgi:hypothetical protein